jgi:hypothetical protein
MTGGIGLFISGVSGEPARKGEFPEFVSDHVFGNEDRKVRFSVVYAEGVSNELRNDGAVAGPSLDNGLLAGNIELLDFAEEASVDVGSLLEGAGHTFAV